MNGLFLKVCFKIKHWFILNITVANKLIEDWRKINQGCMENPHNKQFKSACLIIVTQILFGFQTKMIAKASHVNMVVPVQIVQMVSSVTVAQDGQALSVK